MNRRWLTSILLSLLFSNGVAALDREGVSRIGEPPPPNFVVAGASPDQIRFIYYDIEGDSLEELKRAIKEKGPTDRFGTRRDAFAAWHMRWRWPRRLDGKPDYALTQVECTGEVTVPRWRPSPHTEQALIDEWTRYMEAMIRHESRHLEHCFSERENVRRLLEQAQREDPDLSTEQANKFVRAKLKEIHARDRMYDQTTDHGQAEGVKLGFKQPTQ